MPARSTPIRRLRALGACLLVSLAVGGLSAAPTHAGESASTASDEQELADLHAPLLRTRVQPSACGPGEPYQVMPATDALGRDGVVLRTPEGTAPAPTGADLAGADERSHLDFPGNALRPECDYERLFRSWNTRPTVYARVFSDPDDADTLVLQYWFFYVYNDWNDRHEGDWEGIQLFFDAPDAASAIGRDPWLVAYFQHEGAELSDWVGGAVEVVDDTRPVVYVAEGSHASYYRAERWFGKSAQSGFGCDDTRPAHDETLPAVVLLRDEALPDWATYLGRWGERQPSFNNGPTGPITKAQWTNPVRFVDEEGRWGAVALPAEGSVVTDAFCTVAAGASKVMFRLLDSPVATGTALLAVVVLVVFLVRATTWRPARGRPVYVRRAAGQVVAGALDTIRRRPLLFASIGSLLPAAGVLASVLQAVVLGSTELGDVADVADRGSASGGALALLLGSAFIGPASAIVTVASMLAALRLETGRSVAWREVMAATWRHRRAVWRSLLLTALLAGLASTAVLVPVVVGLISMWAVMVPASLVDSAPLWLSRRLTRGRRMRSLAIGMAGFLVGTVLPPTVGVLVLLITDWSFTVVNLIAGVVGVLLVPAVAVMSLLQYADLRERAGYRVLPD